MTWDEEENAVRELGELIGYAKVIAHAQRLAAPKPKPINLNIGRCIHGCALNGPCSDCETEQANSEDVK